MKFLLISSDRYPPFRVDVAALFGKEMVARGHTIEWSLQSEEDCAHNYETRWRGGTVFVGPTNNGTTRFARIARHWLGLVHDARVLLKVRRRRYDFIQVKDKFLAALLALGISRINGLPMVYWLSFPFPEASKHRIREGTARYPLLYWIRAHALQLVLYRVILPAASHVFVQSDKMKRDLVDQGVDPAKMTPVPMGIDLRSVPSSTRRGNREESSAGATLVYLGTLSSVRRLDFLVRVLAEVRKRHKETRLLFVGDSDLREERGLILDEAERLNVAGAVEITGFLERERALQRVAGADICLSPFYPTFILESTSPTKLVEYMALGQPVVANEHPEQSQVIAESGGGYCVPWEEQAFANAICDLLDRPEEARAMGRRAREYVLANRTYERIAAHVEAEYCRLLARPRGERSLAPCRAAERGR